MTKLAAEHLQESQRRQKCWYDKKSKQRSFEVGQQVLVMFPTENNKLLGKWRGPFKVTKKLGPTTYQIATPGESRSHRTLHINLLKEWFPQKESASVNLIRLVDDEEEIEEQYLSVSQDSSSVNLDHLSGEQKKQIEELCDPELFKSTPGCTTLVQHQMVLKPNAQVKRMSFLSAQ